MRGRRTWLLTFPLAAGLAVAGWWPVPNAEPPFVPTATDLGAQSAPPGPASFAAVVPDTEPSRRRAPTAAPARRAALPPVASNAMGFLAVSSLPWGEVTVDDRRVGPSPQTAISLTAGVHEVRIFRPGYTAYFAKVKIEAGRTVRLTQIVLADSAVR